MCWRELWEDLQWGLTLHFRDGQDSGVQSSRKLQDNLEEVQVNILWDLYFCFSYVQDSSVRCLSRAFTCPPMRSELWTDCWNELWRERGTESIFPMVVITNDWGCALKVESYSWGAHKTKIKELMETPLFFKVLWNLCLLLPSPWCLLLYLGGFGCTYRIYIFFSGCVPIFIYVLTEIRVTLIQCEIILIYIFIYIIYYYNII